MQQSRQHRRIRPRWYGHLLAVIVLSSCSTGNANDGEASADGTFHWTISTVIEVDAPPERVWSVLVDLPAYEEWNPFIVEASGEVAVGEKLTLSMALPGREPMTIEPHLLAVEPQKELRWRGKLFVPGMFDGEHVFELTPLEGGRTRLEHWERFGGLLLPIARGMVYDATVQSFHALNTALAKRAAADS